MTHHFRVLREAGVIRQEREGTTKLTSLRRDDLDARFPGLLDAVLSASQGPGLASTPSACHLVRHFTMTTNERPEDRQRIRV